MNELEGLAQQLIGTMKSIIVLECDIGDLKQQIKQKESQIYDIGVTQSKVLHEMRQYVERQQQPPQEKEQP